MKKVLDRFLMMKIGYGCYIWKMTGYIILEIINNEPDIIKTNML